MTDALPDSLIRPIVTLADELPADRLGGVSSRPAQAASRTGYALFLAVNVMLFVRPGEIIPALLGAPIYEITILLCLLFSLPAVASQLRWETLRQKPYSLCIIGLIFAIAMSHISHRDFYSARLGAMEFSKTVLYYLLFLGLVNTRQRFRFFLATLVVLTMFVATLSLLQWHGIVNIPGMDPSNEKFGDDEDAEDILRLIGSGIFSDPNDLAVLLVVTIVISLQFLLKTGRWLARILWVAPISLCGYAFSLTQSRGGLLALLGGLFTLLLFRFGWKRAILVSAVLCPVLFMVLGGRQTAIDLNDTNDTAQGRIHLWAEAFELFKESPLFGVGQGMMAEEVGHVAHNSFAHGYADLGFLGGTFFLGAVAIPLIAVMRLRKNTLRAADSDLFQVWPCVTALLVGFVIGIHTLSRCYAPSTYVVLGLVGAFLGLVGEKIPSVIPQFTSRLAGRLVLGSIGFLIYLDLFIRIALR